MASNHPIKTADGVIITDGMRLYDPYNMDEVIYADIPKGEKPKNWVKATNGRGNSISKVFGSCMYFDKQRCEVRRNEIEFKRFQKQNSNFTPMFTPEVKQKIKLKKGERVIRFKDGEEYIISL